MRNPNKGSDTVAATDDAPALPGQFCLCSDEGAMTADSRSAGRNRSSEPVC